MKSFTDINLRQLEREWLIQPKLYDRYASKLADAKLDLSEAEAMFEAVCAKEKLQIRKRPKKYGFSGRVTNDLVKELLVLSPKYMDALRNINQTKHRVDVLQGVINTLEHRKRTLEGLVQLHGQSYFSKPKLPDSVKTGFKDEVEGASFRRGKKMRRNKGSI